jgi:DNA polymerase III epsilon subunit family exonuclease
MTRAVLFDTETTGLDPATGDRVLEVAALELINDLPTGDYFHALIDPERDIPEEVTRIHGFRSSDLAGKPKFAEVAADLMAFFGDARLIAHNAPFDFGFLNAEFQRLDLPLLHLERMIDTLVLAKARFPGMPNSLDALCRRFAIDLSQRDHPQRAARLPAAGGRLCRTHRRPATWSGLGGRGPDRAACGLRSHRPAQRPPPVAGRGRPHRPCCHGDPTEGPGLAGLIAAAFPAVRLVTDAIVDHPAGGTYLSTGHLGQGAPRRITCSHPWPERYSRTPTIVH